MSMFYYIDPEVAGSFGEKSIIDSSFHPPKVLKMHYEFDGWMGGELLEYFSSYIVSENLKNILINSELTGATIVDAIVSKSSNFEESNPEILLPKFYWLQVTGKAGVDDIGISNDYRLVVSKKILKLLKAVDLGDVLIEDV